MLLSRREFTARLGAVAILTVVRPSPSTLRVGTVLDPDRPELARGVAFGLAEADRSGSLFGWRVERASVSRPGFDVDVHAVISAVRLGRDPAVPLLSLVCDPGIRGALVLPRCRTPQDAMDIASRVVPWHESLVRYGAAQLNDRYRAATGTGMSGDAWLGWFAMKVIAETAVRTGTTDARRLQQALHGQHFDGHKGVPLHFDAAGRLVHPSYEVRRGANGTWRVAREVAWTEGT